MLDAAAPSTETDALIAVRGLRVAYPDHARRPLMGAAPRVDVLHGIDLELGRGRITGIVGESGSGKSTLGRALVRLLRPDAGTIAYDGADIAALPEARLAPMRRDLQMIFQDPMSSLNPRHRVWRIVAAPMRRFGLGGTRADAEAALERVRLGAAFADRYPHELSGGQRQRVGIARAVALHPRFILADEIVSGLDVSSQANVLALLQGLAREDGITIAFISHDLSVIRHLCDDVIVLDHGRIVDAGPVARVFEAPGSDVTRALIAAIPTPRPVPGWLDDAAGAS
jgi:peptide/nickel transport system ATP-binding protein